MESDTEYTGNTSEVSTVTKKVDAVFTTTFMTFFTRQEQREGKLSEVFVRTS